MRSGATSLFQWRAQRGLLVCVMLGVLPLTSCVTSPGTTSRAYQATGIKISDPTSSTVSIWTRVTRDAVRAGDDRPLPVLRVFDKTTGAELAIQDNALFTNGRPGVSFAKGSDRGSIRGAAVGAAGQTRVRYRMAGSEAWSETEWLPVSPERDFTKIFGLSDLQPGTHYAVEVQARKNSADRFASVIHGGFRTAPAPAASADVRFCVMTCQQYEDRDSPDGFKIYPSMLKLQPDFFVNTGDAVYYDHGPVHALTLDLARYHWARMFSLPALREFYRQVGSYFMRDDHDTLADDCHPGDRTGDFTFGDGLALFREQTAQSLPPYRTIRWGKHLQLWLLEGRETRSSREADRTNSPILLGAEQVAWLESTLAGSDATFRVVLTPTPIVGPDREAKNDNLSNAGYSAESLKIRNLFAGQKNLTVITGDRHWQYVSRDKLNAVEEWSVGAASDAHAAGWDEDKPRPEHLFLRIRHGGFLSGAVQTNGAYPALLLQLHDVDGAVVFEKAAAHQ